MPKLAPFLIAGPRALRRLVAMLALLLVAGCQPMPHPFADSVARPGTPALRPPDSAGIVVLPVTGAPDAAAAGLAAALAQGLRDADVPASTAAENRGSYRLATLAAAEPLGPGRAAVMMTWELKNAAGTSLGKGQARREAASAAWEAGDAMLVAELAGATVPTIAGLVIGDAPLPGDDVAAMLAVGSVTGAPGDGGTALARAMVNALGHAGIDVGESGAKARFALSCEVAVSPQANGQQHVQVRWVLRAANGNQLGQVSQENAVPAGSLDRAWGDVAYAVAGAAAPGIANLVARASSAGS